MSSYAIFGWAFLMFLVIELPIYLAVFIGVIAYAINIKKIKYDKDFHPDISVTIPCYSEKEGALICVKTLVNQDYDGHIQINAIVDGSVQNKETYDILIAYKKMLKHPLRALNVIGKPNRQGRVSSLNLGFVLAKYDYVLALDADNTIHPLMVQTAMQNFKDPNVVAGTGAIYPSNENHSLITKLQGIEYTLGITLGRTGLASLGVINNISGAFGVFRKKVLQEVGAWDNGSAEDLDLTLRLKQRLRIFPNEKLFFDPNAIVYTEVPPNVTVFMQQRLRWNGDLGYMYIRKRWRAFWYNSMGWTNNIYTAWYGILHQIITPFMIFFYTIFFGLYDPMRFIIVGSSVYLLYLLLHIIYYVFYLVCLSNNRIYDMRFIIFIPIYPIFQYFSRLWDVVAHLNELFRKGHLDSAMAPKHILRRAKW